MSRRAALVTALLLLLGLVAVPGISSAAPAKAPKAPSARALAAAARGHAQLVPGELSGHQHARLCGTPKPGKLACNAIRDTSVLNAFDSTGLPFGYAPADLQSAYSLPSGFRGDGQTVAIVDAYDDPTAADDLAQYRSTFGLPPCGDGCFTKLNQAGDAGDYPDPDPGWAGEISLDLDMVSAACPRCNITLVEANSSSDADLAAAVNTAAALNPVAISNSYGGPEYPGETNRDSAYNHPGIAITVSAGDDGYGVQYPAASPYVTAVGGTSLYPDRSARAFHESAWGGAGGGGTGSGCSTYETKPTWQTDSLCGNRTVNDVSAVADPDTGVAVYDSTGSGGWTVYGGTSAASPLVAATYALAGTPGAEDTPSQYAYQNHLALNDVTSGHNDDCGTALCIAVEGYDAPTGLGTPNGIAAFGPPNPQGGAFEAVAPRRILDTRSGLGGTTGPVPANSYVRLQAGGVAGVPLNASAVALNLTVTQPGAAGWVAAEPAANPKRMPSTSNVNYVGGQTVANSVVVPVNYSGQIDLYNYEHNNSNVQLVADVSGYFLPSSPGDSAAFFPVPPTRIVDTRDGTNAPDAPLPSGVPLKIKVNDPSIAAVAINVTVTQPQGPGFLTVYPDSDTPPNASNLNFGAGQTVANAVIVPVGPDGYVDILNTSKFGGTVEVIADVSGYFSTGSGSGTGTGAYGSVTPTRILDTRDGTGGTTGPVTAGQVVPLTVTGNADVPSGASAAIVNLTVTSATSAGYITAYPAGGNVPNVSSLNYVTGEVVPNLAIVPLSADGQLDLSNYEHGNGTVQLVADVFGYFTGSSAGPCVTHAKAGAAPGNCCPGTTNRRVC